MDTLQTSRGGERGVSDPCDGMERDVCLVLSRKVGSARGVGAGVCIVAHGDAKTAGRQPVVPWPRLTQPGQVYPEGLFGSKNIP